jgi:FMN-dependent NADH-azoreductase
MSYHETNRKKEDSMSKILYIKASPRGRRSYSVAAADAFVRAYKKKNPDDQVVELDLFDTELPKFDGFTLQAKYSIMSGQKHTPEEKSRVGSVEKIIEEFKSFDKYIFAVPMWNFNIPYQLKHYIDVIVQPSYTFSYSPDKGYTGLVTGKPVFISCARGGAYGPGTGAEAYDFQSKYLELILGFVGFTDIRTLIIEPTLEQGPETAEKKKSQAILKAEEMAAQF